LRCVIIGNGVTGVTAAIRLREERPDWEIVIVSGESRYHWSRPALMYVFMGHMRYRDTKPYEDSFWTERRLELVRAWVTRIDTGAKRLELHGREPLAYDRLLVATGSRPNRFGWPGQDLEGVQGLWGLDDLTRLHESVQRTRHAVVVGGGLIGIELAEMLHSRGVQVTFLVRESSYWNNILPPEESELVNREIQGHGMELLLGTELDEIEDDGAGRCAAVRTKDGRRLECQLVGLTAGVSPNLAVLEDSGIETGRGVLVDDRMRTSAPDVFAAGDCAELVTPEGERNLVQQVWYTGKLQGAHVARTIAGDDPGPYDPGTWYNSAKFLDLEYQTYGRVNFRVEGEENLVWLHPTERRCARVVHVAGTVIGLQTMGARWRHEVAEAWIEAGLDVREAIDRLGELAFDPEFARRDTPAIQEALRGQLG
jgi:NADPH-dependent 2,4-dienoyl-CoA reductase/sulfur reductase-like enzyme